MKLRSMQRKKSFKKKGGKGKNRKNRINDTSDD